MNCLCCIGVATRVITVKTIYPPFSITMVQQLVHGTTKQIYCAQASLQTRQIIVCVYNINDKQRRIKTQESSLINGPEARNVQT